MNDKIIFDCYYCINSAETKEIMVHYILQPHHFFIRVKAFVFMLVLGGLQFLIISTFCMAPGNELKLCINSTCERELQSYAWLSLH